MRRMAFVLLLMAAAGSVRAEGFEDRLVLAMEEAGYEVIDVHRTLLGRVRVVAVNETLRRELVLNPNTGEILRDYAVLLSVIERRDRMRDRDRDRRSADQPVALATRNGLGSGAETATGDVVVVIPEPVIQMSGD